MVDTLGSGEALRLLGLTARPDTEVWAAACIDYLTTRPEVDPEQLGIVGWSLGGSYAPRAAAFEKRLKLAVAWGAYHNWGEVQHGWRLREERALSRTTGIT
jgi:dienelactone hydrolase